MVTGIPDTNMRIEGYYFTGLKVKPVWPLAASVKSIVTEDPISILDGLWVSTPKIKAETRGPSSNATIPLQYGLSRPNPRAAIAVGTT